MVDPSDPGSLVPLGHVHGAAYSESDSVITRQRIFGLEAPKVALIWQFIGPKEFTYSPTGSTVQDANIPFKFEMDLVNPPGEEILDAPDLALGTFWLYQDANGNGKLDRLIHPEMLALNQAVDTMYEAYLKALARVLEVADNRPSRVDVVDTFYVGRYGALVRMVEGKADTIWPGKGPDPRAEEFAIHIMNQRFRILNHPNRWERFFALRKRSNDYFQIAKPAEGYAMAYEFPYERKLFPLSGKEKLFENRVRDATWKLLDFLLTYATLRDDAISKKWIDYPYSGFGEPNQDWVAGRTRNHTLVYIRNQAGMDEMRAAERGSSFSVTGKEKLHLGYNLIWCGDQYECKVLPFQEPIRIDFGMSEAYFNPPSTPVAYPVREARETVLPTGHLERLQGAYRFQPSHPFCLIAEKGGLWASVPHRGAFRLMPADSLRFFSRATNLQFQIVDPGGVTEKLLLYDAGKRYVALRDSLLAIPETIMAKVRALSERVSIPMPAERLLAFAEGFDHAGDTLLVESAPGGDSLRMAVPGMLPHHYLAASESVFFSRDCDCRATFRHDEAGKLEYLVLERNDSVVWCPAFSHMPRPSGLLFPGIAEADSEVSASGGSMADAYVGIDGKGHYPGSADGRFLKPGDGWVVALDHSLPGDAITLSQGGEGIVFRMAGLAGHAAALDLLLRRDGRTGKGRARFRLRGGMEPGMMDRILAEDFWVEFDGDSATVATGSWPVPADPYYIRLERVATADRNALIAFDGYRLRASREKHDRP